MGPSWRAISGLLLAAVAVSSAPRSIAAQERPIDRWLLSRPFPAASVPEEGPLPTLAELNPLFAPADVAPPSRTQLEEDLARADSLMGRPSDERLDDALARRPPRRPPGQQPGGLRPGWMVRRDSVLFPERGRRVGATVWTLVRQDNNPTFDLDTLVGRSGATATFAHAYIRPQSDRTVTLRFTGLGCTVLSARLNEQPVSLIPAGAPEGCADTTTSTAVVRLARGWNALLVKAEGSEAPYGFAVSIAPGPDGESLDEIRIQASRPPGIQPILPEASIEVAGVRVPAIDWRDDDLTAEVVVEFRLWGGFPPPEAEARIEVGGDRAEHRFEQAPMGPELIETVFQLVRLDRLREVALGEGIEVRLEWKDHDERLTRRIAAEALLRALHEPIGLSGWSGGGASLPSEGARLRGEWKVPRWLSGFTLELLAEGSPGTYVVEGQTLTLASGRAVLCADCRGGERLRIEVLASGAWSSLPRVRIAGPGYEEAASSEGAPPAEHWLRKLGEDGNEDYRRLIDEHAGGAGS